MTKRALSLSCFVLFIIGCNTSNVFGDIPQPVSVDVVFWGSALEVGSISRVCAFGMASYGLAVATHHVDAWTLSDPSLAAIEQMPDPADRYACILLRPRHVGVLTVTASMADLNGVNSIRLIPQISAVRVTPSNVTLTVGDTASVTATVIAATGDTLRDLPIVWRSSNYSVSSVVFYGLGPFRSVIEADAPGQTSITAEAATSRRTLPLTFAVRLA
jgi:hypothetical protein